jgi:glycerol-3-phosphate dehydrogenase (NAD+)
VGANSAAGKVWRRGQLAAKMRARLLPLDQVDAMHDTATETDVKHLRYEFMRYNADKMPLYWEGIMPPNIAREAMAEVDGRLRASLESLVHAGDSAGDTCDAWWREQALPTSMGGANIGGHADLCGHRYAGTVLACLQDLLASSTVLTRAHVDAAIAAAAAQAAGAPPPTTAVPVLPMLLTLCLEYDAVCRMRDGVAAEYAEYDKHPYHYLTLTKTKISGYYRPASLPPAKRLPAISDVLDLNQQKITAPAQRALCLVGHHRRWLDCRAAARAADAAAAMLTRVRHREETRFVAASQPGAGALLDITADGTFGTKIQSPDFAIYLQRRGGLNISLASDAFNAQGLPRDAPERKGDALANGGEYNRRHNAVVSQGRQMVAAVAVGPVILGDKERPELTRDLNAGHTLDLAELGGDDATGGDVIYEFKVPTPLKQKYLAGVGTAQAGGVPATAGHLYAFGSTQEHYELDVLGAPERGRQRDGPFDHTTGRGWVKAKVGGYDDAINNKRTKTVLFLVEATGGIAPSSRRQMHMLTDRARGRGAIDRTRYGRTRFSTKSYYKHWEQRLSKAAVLLDAAAIRKQVMILRQKVLLAAHAAAGGDGTA